MKKTFENFIWVVLVAVFVCIPSAVVNTPYVAVPSWYAVLSALARALGTGMIAVVFGTIVLVVRRNHLQSSLKPALIVTASVGVFASFAAVYPLLKG
jgi:uncharacterized membrane protein